MLGSTTNVEPLPAPQFPSGSMLAGAEDAKLNSQQILYPPRPLEPGEGSMIPGANKAKTDRSPLETLRATIAVATMIF
ncbi:hypothetical protein HDU97_004950 [Phlyctochytrium planicorne]|nr:hypothetical protein HDU97_004950 [Phlyctochytrium planicorne]